MRKLVAIGIEQRDNVPINIYEYILCTVHALTFKLDHQLANHCKFHNGSRYFLSDDHHLTVEGGGHGDPLPGVHPAVQRQARGLGAQVAVSNLHAENGSVLVAAAQLQQLHKTVAGCNVLYSHFDM